MIWLIGANGMLGSEIKNLFHKNNINFIGTGSEVDIRNSENLDNFFNSMESQNYYSSHNKNDPDGGKITWIINCAGLNDVEYCEKNPEEAKALNQTGALNVARCARSHNVKLIHISTDMVFSGKEDLYTESSEKNPLNVFGTTKSLGEESVKTSMTQYYIIRTSWLYGYSKKSFVHTILNLLEKNDELNVISDQKGSPTNCEDVAQVILKIIEKSEKATSFFGKNSAPAYGIYNYTNSGSASKYDFACEIQKNAGKLGMISNNSKIVPCSSNERQSETMRPARTTLSCEKIAKELKIKIPDWKDSLKRFMTDKRFSDR